MSVIFYSVTMHASFRGQVLAATWGVEAAHVSIRVECGFLFSNHDRISQHAPFEYFKGRFLDFGYFKGRFLDCSF